MRLKIVLISAALALLGTACGETTTPASLAAASPTPADPQEHSVPVETATVAPTFTPTASVTPAATSSDTPSPLPPTATPSATATPEGQIGPNNYPPDVNLLTGEQVTDPAVLQRRPLAIKISNFPLCVRPQDGLGRADLVFEHYAEGGTTRFTALFLSEGAQQVGSVRSARLIDIEIPAMYHAMFDFSGASGGVKQRLENSDFFEQIISPDFEPGHPAFFRKPLESVPCDLLEHTLFTGTERLWQTTEERGLNQLPDLSGTVFNPNLPQGGEPGNALVVRYTASFVFWEYSARQGRYFRWNDGAPHRDGLDDRQINVANVALLFANHVTSDILEDFVGYNRTTGEGGNYSVEIQLWGSGPALIFRDGQVFEATWVRQERFGPPALIDEAGVPVPLKPGETWFQLVPLDTSVEPREGGEWLFTPPRPSAAPSFLATPEE